VLAVRIGTLAMPTTMPLIIAVSVCPQATALMAQFRAMGIVLGHSWHPKDVPFVSEFCWGMYGFGAISLQRTPPFGEMSTFGSTKLHMYWCILFSSTAARVFNELTYLLTLTSSLYCPQIHCNPSSLSLLFFFPVFAQWLRASYLRRN